MTNYLHSRSQLFVPPARIKYSPSAAARALWRKPVALVIDVDEDLRRIFAQLLAQVGYAVVTADNADDARRLAILMSPKLVLTDLRTGLHDVRLIPAELRRLPALAWTPMIVTSAWDLPQDRALAESVGAELFTTPPVNFRAIRALAVRLIQRPGPTAGVV